MAREQFRMSMSQWLNMASITLFGTFVGFILDDSLYVAPQYPNGFSKNQGLFNRVRRHNRRHPQTYPVLSKRDGLC